MDDKLAIKILKDKHSSQRLKKTALSFIYDQYHEKIYHLIRLKVSSPTEAMIITDKVFERIEDYVIRKGKTIKLFHYFLNTVWWNLVKNWYRRPRLIIKPTEVLVSISQPSISSPIDNAENKEESFILRQVINKLKNDVREVIILRYYQYLSPHEIADLLKKNIKRIYKLLNEGKKQIRVRIGSKL